MKTFQNIVAYFVDSKEGQIETTLYDSTFVNDIGICFS